MTSQIIGSLEKISKAARNNSLTEAESAIKKTRELLGEIKNQKELGVLDSELATWQTKLEVIFKEPVGRNGMAKHLEYWKGVILRSAEGTTKNLKHEILRRPSGSSG